MRDGEITMAELGPRLKLVRQELGITQRELAQELGLNQAILSKFENGGMVYASVLLQILCFYRGRININYLLQPGNDYNINDDRARFSNDKQRDFVVRKRRDLAVESFKQLMAETIERGVKGIESLAEFCYSEPDEQQDGTKKMQ